MLSARFHLLGLNDELKGKPNTSPEAQELVQILEKSVKIFDLLMICKNFFDLIC